MASAVCDPHRVRGKPAGSEEPHTSKSPAIFHVLLARAVVLTLYYPHDQLLASHGSEKFGL